MSQVVMSDSICADFLACTIKRFLAFAHTKDFCVQTLRMPLSAHAFKQRTSIGDQRDPAHCPILCGRFRVAAHNNLASFKVHIAPCDLTRFAFSAEQQKSDSSSAALRA